MYMEVVTTYWPVGTGMIMFILWLARLEFLSKENHERIRKLESKEADLQKTLQEILNKLEHISTNMDWLMKGK